MILKIFLILLWSSLMLVQADMVKTQKVVVKVSNIEVTRGGDIIVFIFGKEGYPKVHDKALSMQRKSVSTNVMEFTFNIAVDEMAIKVLHDENGDGKVTKDWTGIMPKDGLGFSNNQRISITGLPTYKKSKLSIGDIKKEVEIALRYKIF